MYAVVAQLGRAFLSETGRSKQRARASMRTSGELPVASRRCPGRATPWAFTVPFDSLTPAYAVVAQLVEQLHGKE